MQEVLPRRRKWVAVGLILLLQFATIDQEEEGVWIAGKHLGGGMVAYGIENYFIEEGQAYSMNVSHIRLRNSRKKWRCDLVVN